MNLRRAVALAFASTALGACGAIVGIEDLDVDAPLTNGVDAQAPEGSTAPTPEASAPDVVDSAVDAAVDAGTSKHVFLTSTASGGSFDGANGIAAADALCKAAATRAGLGGRPWVAWLSDGKGTKAIDRIKHQGAYFTLTDRRIVVSKAQLTSGNLDGPINVMENKETATSAAPWVWTGTQANGEPSASCNDWTTDNFGVFGAAGSFDRSADGKWTDNGGPGAGFPNFGCQSQGRLYCFEQ